MILQMHVCGDLILLIEKKNEIGTRKVWPRQLHIMVGKQNTALLINNSPIHTPLRVFVTLRVSHMKLGTGS